MLPQNSTVENYIRKAADTMDTPCGKLLVLVTDDEYSCSKLSYSGLPFGQGVPTETSLVVGYLDAPGLDALTSSWSSCCCLDVTRPHSCPTIAETIAHIRLTELGPVVCGVR